MDLRNDRLFDESPEARIGIGRYDPFLWDAVIIGAGAAGAVFAYELTRAGLKVLLLELGRHYTDHRGQFQENEMAMWERTWSNTQYDVSGDAFTGAPNLGMGVGGGTLVWAAVSLRFFEHDFRMRSTYGQPAGTSVEDWPLTLSELEPYYSLAERQMGVAGEVGPWDPPSRPAPPYPPHPLYPASRRLQEGMARLGIRSAAGSVAVLSRPAVGRGSCLHCGYCRSSCRIDAKYQSDHTLIKAALATGRLKLVAGAVVTRINQRIHPHLATGVTYYDTAARQFHRVRGRFIVAANNPIEIPRLFLASANPWFPTGLGNRYDNVGRHFFTHPAMIAVGVTDECLDSGIGFNMANLITLDYCRGRPSNPYIGGFSVESLNGAGAGVLAVDPYRGLWGSELKRAMRNYNRSMFTIAFCEGMPVPDNRVTIDPDNTDEFGRPRAAIHYTWHENDRQVFSAALETSRRIMTSAGARAVYLTETPFESHPAGTMRMGDNPRTSVTDRFGRVHGLENVYVGGAALFVTGSSVNPTLTLHALALRSARHLLRRLGRRFDAD
jgi:choline dehydrogenase-like flavoprotein